MEITRTLGGDRLGSGGNMKVRLHNYEMSTHDLGRVIRTTATNGTIIPIYVELAQKGDSWDIDLASRIRTHPTIGPIFGTFKFQIDVFTADMRLYNRQLHNNTVGLGMNMQNVLFPQMVLNGKNPEYKSGDLNIQQIAPDSLLAYLGIRGLGTREEGLGGDTRIEIKRNAMPLLAYWDIYKNYYTNKQEEIGYCISPIVEYIPAVVNSITYQRTETSAVQSVENITSNTNGQIAFGVRGWLRITGENLSEYTSLRTIIEYDNGIRIPIDIESFPAGQIEYGSDGTYIEIKDITRTVTIIYDTANNAWITGGGTGNAIVGDLNVREFPLSNIDDVRETILAHPKTSPLTIGYDNNHTVITEPYISTTGQTEISETTNRPTANSDMISRFEMSGLGIKTYQSDRFNNWLNKTWVENINAASAVQIVDGSFTMDALLLSRKIYDQQNRIAISGGTYQDWLEVTYGQEVPGAPEMPVYRGGYSANITFDEVVSSSSASSGGATEPLGTLGGRGTQANEKGGNISFKITEHGYVIVLMSITPRIDYHQGNKWHMKLETMDDIHKPAYDKLGFQDLLTDELAAFDTKVSADGTETFKSAGKQLSWTQYMTNWNEAYGNFARANKEQFMILTRRYEADEDGNISDLTTYIDPTKFNYPFAYLGIENQPYWIQVAVDAKVRRKMAAHQVPNL